MSSAEITSKITDAVTLTHRTGGDEALTIIARLMDEVASSLDRAKQGETTIDDISDAFENAEIAMHSIAAKLTIGSA
jgi:ATP-dependent protease Clp ATPase subunit